MTAKPETYWMIEKSINGRAHWWVSYNWKNGSWDSSERWTIDSSVARHFQNKDEALFVMGNQMTDCEATEHMDMINPILNAAEKEQK